MSAPSTGLLSWSVCSWELLSSEGKENLEQFKERTSFPWCSSAIRDSKNHAEGFSSGAHTCVWEAQDTKVVKITSFCGRALAALRLQKAMAEQADPLGVSDSLCHHQVCLDANTFNGNFICSFARSAHFAWKRSPADMSVSVCLVSHHLHAIL